MKRINSCLLFVFLVVASGGLRAEDLQEPSTAARAEDVQRQQFWQNSDMVEARMYMEEYFATSAQTTQEEAEAFWADLDAMSTSELADWLAHFSYQRRQRARLMDSSSQTREYKLAEANEARRRDEQINAQFNRLVRQGANLAQNRVEKGFDRTSKQKRYPWYPRRRHLWFWARF